MANVGLAFASNGSAANDIAEFIISIVCFIGGIILIYGLFVIGYLICSAICEFYKKLNIAGKIVIFGIPSVSLIIGAIYGIVLCISSMSNTDFYIYLTIFGIITYFSLACVGWCDNSSIKKREGKIALICRIIFVMPYLPIIYLIKYVKEFFGFAFIKNYIPNWSADIFTVSGEEKRKQYEKEMRKYYRECMKKAGK